MIIKVITIILIALACFSCSSDEGSSKSTVKELSEVRSLDVSADNVSIIDIETYFSPNRYGPTLKLYNIQGQKAVIKIRINNESDDFGTSVVVYVFDNSLEGEKIKKWLNNQYSDGLFSDAPSPIGTYRLSTDQYSINSYSLINHTVESYGDEYDNYDIELYVDNVFEDGVKLKSLRKATLECLCPMSGTVVFLRARAQQDGSSYRQTTPGATSPNVS